MKSLEQVERLVIDCILAGIDTNPKLYAHAEKLGIGNGKVFEALESLQRKIWIISEPGRWWLTPKWRVMPIGKVGAKRLQPFHAGVEVVEATVSQTGLKAVCRDIGGNYTVMRSEETVMVFRDKEVG